MRWASLRNLMPRKYRNQFARWLIEDRKKSKRTKSAPRHRLKNTGYRLGGSLGRSQTGWVEVKVGKSGRSQVMPVSKEIIEQLPASTETFVDRGVLDVVRMRLSDIIAHDESHHPS